MNRRIHIDMQVVWLQGKGTENAVSVQPVSNAQKMPPKIYDSETLFDGSKEIGIAHEGSLYRLKITRQGKLILNK